MSGILGIWNLDGRPVEHAVLSRLSAPLAHRGPDGEGRWVQGPVGLACRLLRVTPESSAETQPLVHVSGTVVVFDGRLDDRDELLALLGGTPDISDNSPDPALVLAAYAAFGDRFTEHLNGDFALALFDPKGQRLLLARDAIGIRPLYYARAGNAFLFATELKAVLAHPKLSPRPNEDTLAGLVTASLYGGRQDETFFAGVSSVPPAHMAVVTPRGVVQRRYWDFDPTRKVRLRSYPEYVEAFRHYFEQAVRRRLRSAHPVAVAVSGGLDSSAIFCLAETLRRREPGLPPLLGVSYAFAPGSPSDEQAYLREIERGYGAAIQRFPMGQTGPLEGIREQVWHVESPVLDLQWHNTNRFRQAARQLGARVLLTGQWGDNMLVDQAYLIDLLRRLKWSTVSAHLREYGRWFPDLPDPNFFRRRFIARLVRYHVPQAMIPLLRRLRDTLLHSARARSWYSNRFRQRVYHEAPRQDLPSRPFATAHARSLYQESRATHNVLSMEWNNKAAALQGLEIAFPFLDRDLLSFLLAIPGEVQTWKGVPKALLREALRGVLPDAIAQRRTKADFTDLVNAGTKRDYPELMDCLRDGLAVQFGYVQEEVLSEEFARLKDRVQGRDCEVAWKLSDLLGLEQWLQVFLGEQTSQKEKTHDSACGRPESRKTRRDPGNGRPDQEGVPFTQPGGLR
jgi:asparagine synthase (glutamine-hydrolysing)